MATECVIYQPGIIRIGTILHLLYLLLAVVAQTPLFRVPSGANFHLYNHIQVECVRDSAPNPSESCKIPQERLPSLTHTHTHKFPVSIERTSKNPWLNPQEDCQSLASKWKTANGYRCGGAVPDERRHTQSHLQNPLESNNLTIELTKDVPPQ